MNNFYLTLPSNSSMELYPDNTLAHYVTKLPQRIELDGQWEVGLVEIQYPHSWYNIPEDCDRQMTIMHTLDSGLIETNIFHIPPGYYKPETLLERIKTLATYVRNSPNLRSRRRYHQT